MTSSSGRPMEVAREGSGTFVSQLQVSDTFVSQPHALEGVGEYILNEYVPHTSGS